VTPEFPRLALIKCCLGPGTGGFSVEEVVAACFSLQRIAAQALDTDEETGRFLHDIIIPRLLSLALQAALQGDLKLPTSSLLEA